MFTVARDAVRGFMRGFVRDEAQDVFEYVLIIGILTVAVLLAVSTDVGENLIDAVIHGTCLAVQGLMDTVDCSAVGVTPPVVP